MNVVNVNFELAGKLEALAGQLDWTVKTDRWPNGERGDALRAALSESVASVREAGLRGVPELLRLLQSGLEQRGASPVRIAERECDVLTLWLLQLASYCAGGMTANDYPKLVDAFTQVPWMPAVAPRMRECILARLIESAPVDTGSEQVFEPMSDEVTGGAEPTMGKAVAAAFEPLFAEPSGTWGNRPVPPVQLMDSLAAGVAVCEGAAQPLEAFGEHSAADPAKGIFDEQPGEFADGGEAIWIGPEELALAASAITTQLLPLTQQLFETQDRAEQTGLLGELDYQTGLIASAFEVLGLPRLWEVSLQVQALLRSATEDLSPAPPYALVNWQVAMLDLLQHPHHDAIDLLCQTATELVGGFDRPALVRELKRIRIGMDPSRISERKQQAALEDIDLQIAPDVLPDVLDGMLRELPVNASRLGEGIRSFLAGRSADDLSQARRYAHTLKGDANTVGLRGLANITHALEDVLLELASRSEPAGTQLAEVLKEAADAVEMIADHVLRAGPAPDDLLSTYQRLLDAANVLFLDKVEAAGSPYDLATFVGATGIDAGLAPERSTVPADAAPARVIEASHSVPISLLDELLRLAGESVVLMRQIEQRVKAVGGAYRELIGQNRVDRDLVAQLDDLVALRGAALKSTRLAGAREADPLELDQYTELHVVSRRMIECNSDRAAFMQRMDGDLLTLDDLLSMQERAQADLQRLVLKTRTIPLSHVTGRLQRVVRQVAQLLFKSVELEIDGADTQIDSEMIDRIVEPLSHILRNAVDHGIESPEERKRAGKPECGRIRLAVTVRGDTIGFLIADDGRGLDLDAVRRRANEVGLLDAGAEIGDDELARLVLLPGFSTRAQATQVSGRGIGMDIVTQRVSDLRGTLALRSTGGKGLEIQIRLPASLTSANVVLARDGDDQVAAIASSVASIVALEPNDFNIGAHKRLYAHVDGDVLPAIPLSALFDKENREWAVPDSRRTGLIVEAVGMDPHVIYTTSVDEVRNVIVKNLGAGLAPVPALRGVTRLGDGGIAPVLDLAQSVQEMGRLGSSYGIALDPAVASKAVPRIVIADDSLSVRRALAQLMQDAGYCVVTARDGIEALDAIRDAAPIAALLDLEMPRLNGLDVTRYLRSQRETAALPIVMITSRATDKYRAMAHDAGVTRLVGKPFDEDALVLLILQLTTAAAQARLPA